MENKNFILSQDLEMKRIFLTQLQLLYFHLYLNKSKRVKFQVKI